MKSTPLLSTYNRFEVLANISNFKTTSLDVQKTKEIPIPVQIPTPSIPKRRKPKWEKALPEKLTIATAEGTPNSLSLKMEIETTDTAEKRSITALVDSGVTGKFIDRQYAKSCWFKLVKLTQPIPVYNVDGSPMKLVQYQKPSASFSVTKIIQSGPPSVSPIWVNKNSCYLTS